MYETNRGTNSGFSGEASNSFANQNLGLTVLQKTQRIPEYKSASIYYIPSFNPPPLPQETLKSWGREQDRNCVCATPWHHQP